MFDDVCFKSLEFALAQMFSKAKKLTMCVWWRERDSWGIQRTSGKAHGCFLSCCTNFVSTLPTGTTANHFTQSGFCSQITLSTWPSREATDQRFLPTPFSMSLGPQVFWMFGAKRCCSMPLVIQTSGFGAAPPQITCEYNQRTNEWNRHITINSNLQNFRKLKEIKHTMINV